MSPKAVTDRLRIVSQLRDLCLSLAKAKPIKKSHDNGSVKESETTEATGK